MNEIMHLNNIHLAYLNPLVKWRVMNIESLRDECIESPNYHNFCKIIRSLEKAKILEGYRHPFNKKKYVYLSSLGERELSPEEKTNSLSKDTLIHDILVSDFTKVLVSKGWMDHVTLEHELNNKKGFKVNYKIIPDALLEGEKNKTKFNMALELELSRKSNQRIVEKAKLYESSSYYNYVLYVFSKNSMMLKYKEVIGEAISDLSRKFIFFSLEDLNNLDFSVEQKNGCFKNKEVSLKEIFEG